MMNRIVIVILVVASFNFNSAQNIFGKWKTIDDETGETKSIVEIYENNGKVYGKIVDILTDNRDAICSKCEDDKKDKPVLGMVIIDGLKKEDEVYEGGTILNPENGKVYKCRLKIEEDEDTLQVRGYVAFFYKTQYWKRVD